MLTFGHKEALAALGLHWSGFLNWTNRLWSTATMAAASLLGGGFFLTITAMVMLLVHKWLSRWMPLVDYKQKKEKPSIYTQYTYGF